MSWEMMIHPSQANRQRLAERLLKTIVSSLLMLFYFWYMSYLKQWGPVLNMHSDYLTHYKSEYAVTQLSTHICRYFAALMHCTVPWWTGGKKQNDIQSSCLYSWHHVPVREQVICGFPMRPSGCLLPVPASNNTSEIYARNHKMIHSDLLLKFI